MKALSILLVSEERQRIAHAADPAAGTGSYRPRCRPYSLHQRRQSDNLFYPATEAAPARERIKTALIDRIRDEVRLRG